MNDENDGFTIDPMEDVDIPVALPSPAAEIHEEPDEILGQWVGPYRAIRLIGEGGMGEVYEARQEEPVRRSVALKLIKKGMDSKRVVARFESERQALAMMNHASIARVFDAGTSKQGQPFFAMEYVEGVPITDYCDAHRLDNRQRLDLFIKVCEGVQHAHQKGIIHRDIKPSNVLVTLQDNESVPKIIDFGIAKAMDQRLTDSTMYTEMGQLVGTPEYMSPEQAEMTATDIDTRTDVYSLGVLLYELLTGELPFSAKELKRVGFNEFRRKVLEDEPQRPSGRLKSLSEDTTITAERRHADVASLSRQLRGDLDWITMRALEKDRTRRYDSASELAAEVRRYLENEPVLAGPPGARYRMGKFVRRHKAGVAFATVLLFILIGFATTMTVQTRLIAAERDRANLQAEATGQVADYLTGMFKRLGPSEARGGTITVKEILDVGASRIDTEPWARPEVQADVMSQIGQAYLALGFFEEARPLLFKAFEARNEHLDPDDPRVVDSLNELAALLSNQGDHEGALDLAEKALASRRRTLPPDHADVRKAMNNVAVILTHVGQIDRAAELLEEVYEIRRASVGPDHKDTAISLLNLASMERRQARFDRAHRHAGEALAILDEIPSIEPLTLEAALTSYAKACDDIHDRGAAKQSLERVLESRQDRYPPAHPRIASTFLDLAVHHARYGEEAEAVRFHRLAQMAAAHYGSDREPSFLYRHAGYEALRGNHEEALADLRQSVVDHSYQGVQTILSDPTLAPLHGDPEFDAVVEAVRKRTSAR